MKLLATIREPHQADTRARNRESNPSEQVDDTSHQSFDGVLAKVTSKQPPTTPTTLPADTAASTPADPSSKDATALDRIDPTLTVQPSDLAIIGGKRTTSADAAADEATVGALLKRIKAKDADEGSQPTAEPKAAAPDLSLIPGLAAGLRIEPVAGVGNAAPKAGDAGQTGAVQKPDMSGAVNPTQIAGAPQGQGAAVLGVSVSTHLAPVTGGDRSPPASDDKALTPTQHADAQSTASTAADGAGSKGHDDHPPSTDKGEETPQVKVEGPAVAAAGVAPQAPIRGIATAVVTLAQQTATAAAGAATPTTVATAPAQTVTLQLSPADLGTVEIRLHLTGQALDLQLTISEPSTLGLVSRERETLTKALETHNYELNSLVIQDGSAVSTSGGTHVANHESSGDAQADRGKGGDGAGTQAGRDGRSDRNADEQPRGNRRPLGEAARRADASGGRSLFI